LAELIEYLSERYAKASQRRDQRSNQAIKPGRVG